MRIYKFMDKKELISSLKLSDVIIDTYKKTIDLLHEKYFKLKNERGGENE